MSFMYVQGLQAHWNSYKSYKLNATSTGIKCALQVTLCLQVHCNLHRARKCPTIYTGSTSERIFIWAYKCTAIYTEATSESKIIKPTISVYLYGAHKHCNLYRDGNITAIHLDPTAGLQFIWDLQEHYNLHGGLHV